MMASFAQPRTFAARTVGVVARRFLDGASDGKVIAVFRSVFYAGAGPELVCVGTRALEPGPVNLITTAPADTDWRASGVRVEGRVALSAREFRVGHQFRIPLAGAATWSPDKVAEAINPAAVTRGLAAFREAFASRAIEAGLGRFIDPGFVPGQRDHECRAAETPIAEARRWLVHAFTQTDPAQREAPGWIGKLTGLGSGLTPAGDDILGGMMIALHGLGHASASRWLWSRVRTRAGRQTNAISVALLGAASRGLGSASVHAAVSAIVRGDRVAIQNAMPGVDRIGHSSGWDAMTGIVMVLDCWLPSRASGDCRRDLEHHEYRDALPARDDFVAGIRGIPMPSRRRNGPVEICPFQVESQPRT